MITLLVSYYAEDPLPAVESATAHLPIDRSIVVPGRWQGFPVQTGDKLPAVWDSEHEKRNTMLAMAEPADPERWLLWLDCDERVIYGSPGLEIQLQRLTHGGGVPANVAGIRFIEPLDPDAPGLIDPRHSVRDHVNKALPRLIRHLPGLQYTHRHDHLVDGDGRLLVGWERELPEEPVEVDVIAVHLKDTQSPERVAAKQAYYGGPVRQAESRALQ